MRTATEWEVAMTDRTGSGSTIPTPPNAGWRKSRHSNPDGSCLEVTVLTGRTTRPTGVADLPNGDRSPGAHSRHRSP